MKIFLVLLGACVFMLFDLFAHKQVVPAQPQSQDAHDGTCGYC